MIWTKIDELTGSDPLANFDRTIQARVAVAFSMIMAAIAIVNSAVIGISGVARPGMIPLAIASGFAFLIIGAAGVRWRRPNLSIIAILVLVAANIAMAIWANRGSFPPAGIYIPAMLLGVLMAWGARAASLVLLPILASFGVVVWLGIRFTGTDLAIDATALLPALVLAVSFACIWVIVLGSAYRTATQSANAELAKKNDELAVAVQAAERATEAKAQFLATMSHEIRTPMNGVLGMLQLLESSNLDNEQRKRTEIASDSAKSLLRVIDDVLDLAKLDSGNFKVEVIEFSPSEVANGVFQLLEVEADKKKLRFDLATEETVPEQFSSDPTRLRQILFNLLGNAVKFTSEGRVSMKLSFSGTDDEGTLTISVSDTGIGIEPQVAEKLFEPFTQADTTTTRKFGGTGLGLAISRRFAIELGGSLEVASEPGKGSVFVLTIPDLRQQASMNDSHQDKD